MNLCTTSADNPGTRVKSKPYGTRLPLLPPGLLGARTLALQITRVFDVVLEARDVQRACRVVELEPEHPPRR